MLTYWQEYLNNIPLQKVFPEYVLTYFNLKMLHSIKLYSSYLCNNQLNNSSFKVRAILQMKYMKKSNIIDSRFAQITTLCTSHEMIVDSWHWLK